MKSYFFASVSLNAPRRWRVPSAIDFVNSGIFFDPNNKIIRTTMIMISLVPKSNIYNEIH